MQLFLELMGRMLMAVLAVLLAQLGLSIEPMKSAEGREVHRSPECVLVSPDHEHRAGPDC
jgi:hypothetical protein